MQTAAYTHKNVRTICFGALGHIPLEAQPVSVVADTTKSTLILRHEHHRPCVSRISLGQDFGHRRYFSCGCSFEVGFLRTTFLLLLSYVRCGAHLSQDPRCPPDQIGCTPESNCVYCGLKPLHAVPFPQPVSDPPPHSRLPASSVRCCDLLCPSVKTGDPLLTHADRLS